MSILNQILQHKIVAIIRGANPADLIKIADALYAGGIRILEITMNSDDPLTAIKAVADKYNDAMIIGAGTVLDGEMVKQAVEAGAKFVLSPIISQDVIQTARTLGVVSIPGAYTATEIYHAFKLGADLVKVFPASSPSYIKDIRGPLPQIPLLPTGGITLDNIKGFKEAGAVGFGIGSALVNTREVVTPAYLSQLTINAKKFVEALNS